MKVKYLSFHLTLASGIANYSTCSTLGVWKCFYSEVQQSKLCWCFSPGLEYVEYVMRCNMTIMPLFTLGFALLQDPYNQ